jgi:ABC-type transporter Mla MlaB component
MFEASDFRYYMHDGSAAFSFELAGRLSDEGARELQQTWETASSMIGDRSLIVDLSYVTGVDAAGQNLLRGWHDQGAQLVAKSPQARALIQSITGQAAGELSATARHSTWLPFQRVIRWAARS